jgi:signal peptidase II
MERPKDHSSSKTFLAAAAHWPVKWVVLLAVTLLISGLDQWSKHWAEVDLRREPGARVTIVEDYLAFSYVQNPGAAWGFLARANESFRKPFFFSISIAAMIFILFIHSRLEPGQYFLLWALSLVMGGAVGNFVDRFRYNYVVDFIEFHVRDRFKWPTFNVADMAITAGVILLFLEMFIAPLILRRRKAASSAAMDGATATSPEDEDQRNE